MRLPSEPVTLSVEQISELKQQLIDLRHDVNNKTALMLSAVEMIRRKPESTANMLDTFARQPKKSTRRSRNFPKTSKTCSESRSHSVTQSCLFFV